MQKACRRGLRKCIAYFLAGRILRRQFSAIHVRNLGLRPPDDEAILYFANHVSPWDGLLGRYLTYTCLQQDPYAMTSEPMLPLARWSGTFSVDSRDRFDVVNAVRYATELLAQTPSCGLWMFPERMAYPYNQRPRNLAPGTSLIIRRVKALVLVPVVFKYSFNNDPNHSDAFVNFGAPFSATVGLSQNDLTAELETRLTHDLDMVSNDLGARRTGDFITIMDTHIDCTQSLRQGVTLYRKVNKS